MSVGETLISKVLDANDLLAFTKYGIEREDFPTETERRVFDFVCQYGKGNGDQTPSYATVTSEITDFIYVPAVTDSFEYLARKLKDSAGKRRIAKILNEEAAQRFDSMDANQYISWLTDAMDRIRMGSSVRIGVRRDVANSAITFLEEYRARKAGLSSRIWPSKFPGLNAALGGGYYSSNMYVVYARSGRGKSVISMEEAIEFAFSGATVLVWALEMGFFEWMARAFSSISARAGITTATIDGVNYDAGFENQALQAGKLPPEYEAAFETFIAGLNELMPGKIILRAANDKGFDDRSLKALRADIIETSAHVVIVDPFYYLDYETNTSKTAGGDAAATSKRLRIMTGELDVVTIAITQADEDASEKGDDGVREMRPPKRAEVKKTKQLLEDGAALIGVDTLAHEGRGVIEIGKGRNGGEDTRIELLYLPNYGIVQEMTNTTQEGQFK